MLVCHACTHENRLLEIHYSSILATRKPKQRELSVARSRFLVNHEFTLKFYLFWFLIFFKKAESLRRYVNAPGKSRSSYRRASLSVCVSPIIISPSRLRSPASTPFPSTSPPSKRPLCTFPKPQAGLRSLRIAASQLNKRASFKISRAPFSYCCVTSALSALITFPSRISAGGRGVGSHPKASGQIGIRWCLSFNSSSMRSRQPVPSYR